MDYKITVLPGQVRIEEEMMAEIPGLKFGVLQNGVAVFDSTSYIEENNLPNVDCKTFMRLNKSYIEHLAKASNRLTSELFYQNADGHILIAYELVILYLSFANPALYVYFTRIIMEAMDKGVAYTNSFVYEIASLHLPSEVLRDIIDERTKEESTAK